MPAVHHQVRGPLTTQRKRPQQVATTPNERGGAEGPRTHVVVRRHKRHLLARPNDALVRPARQRDALGARGRVGGGRGGAGGRRALQRAVGDDGRRLLERVRQQARRRVKGALGRMYVCGVATELQNVRQ